MMKNVENFYTNIASQYKKLNKGVADIFDDIAEKLINKYLPKKRLKILDVGGGIGRFAIPLSKKHDVTLSDISEGMLNQAKKLSGQKKINFVKESITNLSHKNNSFDVVLVMNAVINYCGNHKKALNEVYRVLKKDGLIIGTANNLYPYLLLNEVHNGDITSFENSLKTGNRYLKWGPNNEGHSTHEFRLDELKESFKKFHIVDILGPSNLIMYVKDVSKLNESKIKKLINLQLKLAYKKEYLNNSLDFFFVAKK